jgi:TetR/AcrR family transcriptional regulator, transcriptional repressor for nem operon
MSKGTLTRQRIIATAAPIFNTFGYSGTSMSELLKLTGLEKGGIYNHFPSKQALALAAFDYAIELVAERFRVALEDVPHAADRLRAIVQVFARYVDDPPVAGGCPILNTAIEADDTDPELRARAQAAMLRLQKLIGATVKHGVLRGELRQGADPRAVASTLTALMEGATMLSRLFQDPTHMQRAVEHALAYVELLRSEVS